MARALTDYFPAQYARKWARQPWATTSWHHINAPAAANSANPSAGCHVSKETDIEIKRDSYLYQTSLISVSKKDYVYIPAAANSAGSSAICHMCQKRPAFESKETYTYIKRDLWQQKRPYSNRIKNLS